MFKCKYCSKPYNTLKEAQDCFESHNVVFIPVALADLNGLIHFLYEKDERFLNPNMVKVLKRYAQNNSKKT